MCVSHSHMSCGALTAALRSLRLFLFAVPFSIIPFSLFDFFLEQTLQLPTPTAPPVLCLSGWRLFCKRHFLLRPLPSRSACSQHISNICVCLAASGAPVNFVDVWSASECGCVGALSAPTTSGWTGWLLAVALGCLSMPTPPVALLQYKLALRAHKNKWSVTLCFLWFSFMSLHRM